MTELTLTAPTRPWSTNEERRLHWAERARRVRAWRDAVAWTARAHRADLVRDGSYLPPSVVTITLPFARRARRDPMNYVGTVLKASVDGLVDASLWPDDTADWVEIRQPRFAYGVEIVTITLEPRPNA